MNALDNGKVYTREQISLVCLSASQLTHVGRPLIARMLTELYSPRRFDRRGRAAENAVPLFYAKAYHAGAAKQVWGAASIVYIAEYAGVLCAMCLGVERGPDQALHSRDSTHLWELIAPSAVWAPVRGSYGDVGWGPAPICSDCEVALLRSIGDIYAGEADYIRDFNDQMVLAGLCGLVTSKRKAARDFRARMQRSAAAPMLRFNPRNTLAPALREIGARAKWFDDSPGGRRFSPPTDGDQP